MQAISDFSSLEKLILPPNCSFSNDAQVVINCWESKDILACPGSGKTTVLIAKLKLLAEQLPLPDGRGVCVLSHTNVAVNEIKNKFGELAYKLLSYPNFVGTIQAFIDKYILFPFIKKEITCLIRLVSDEDFAIYLYETIKSTHNDTLRFIISQYQYRKNIFSTIFDFIKNIYIDEEGNLKVKQNSSRIVAKKQNIHAKNFKNARKLLFYKGIIRYRDTYVYVKKIIEKNGFLLREILSRRFAFVFIDEYQDCSRMQCKIFEQIFSDAKTVFQKIGDINQAIYSDENNEDACWSVSQNYLSIACTNRFSQEIADILTPFQSEQTKINASNGYCNINPTLFVYKDISRVLLSFIQEINDNNLIKENGVYKAVGIYQNVKGVKISDYWAQFKAKNKTYSENCYSYFIIDIIKALNTGNLYIAERVVRKLICSILHFTDKRHNNGEYYNLRTIKHFLEESCAPDYKKYILDFVNTNPLTYENIKIKTNKIISNMLGDSIFKYIPDYFTQENQIDSHIVTDNIYKSEEYGINIQFDTVYGVKGETHDATLYLETETKNSSDIIRTIKFLNNNQYNSELYKKNKNCVYVGLSRPKYLLCLAIRHKTYESYKAFFSKWKIIQLD